MDLFMCMKECCRDTCHRVGKLVEHVAGARERVA